MIIFLWVVINGFTFLGTTLWSNIPIDERKIIEYNMNDYKYIYINANTCITAKDTTDIHNDQLDWLNKNIIDNCIIITHHLPHLFVKNDSLYIFLFYRLSIYLFLQ